MAGRSETFVRAVAVTPSDATVLNCVGFYVGTSAPANVAILPRDSAVAVTLVNVIAGTVYNIECAKIMSTNTTASNIVALY